MTTFGSFCQSVQNTRLQTLGRAFFHADLHRNLICRLEADSVDVRRELERICFQHGFGTVPIGFVDAQRPGRTDAVAVKEKHNGMHCLLLHPRSPDFLTPFATNPFHLLQLHGLVFDDIQRRRAKLGQDTLGISWPDSIDQATAEIALQSVERIGTLKSQFCGLELIPVVPCPLPGSGCIELLTWNHMRRVADDSHHLTCPALWQHLQNAVARIFRVKRHPLYRALQAL